MHENITKYLDFFSKNTLSKEELQEQINLFVRDFSQSEFMNPDAMDIMGMRGWATRSALQNAIPTMSAEDACACISAFVVQESFFQGIVLDQIQQGILPRILERLKELDGWITLAYRTWNRSGISLGGFHFYKPDICTQNKKS